MISQSMREITPRAIVLSVFLTVVLAAANAFLALKLGMTISSSIPAAVISMGLFRFFNNKPSSPIENNIVQTAASVGESLVAGLAFIMPALLLLRYWTHFHYIYTMLIALSGGVLGVLYSVPLRRAFLTDKTLSFPEGVAIGNILQANADETADMRALVKGSLAGAGFSLFQMGFELIANAMDYWFKVGSTILGFGLGFSPAVMAAGYIVGMNVCLTIFIGSIIGWVVGVPVLSFQNASHYFPMLLASHTNLDRTQIVMDLWSNHIRYIGVGTMLLGGLWTLATLSRKVLAGVKASIKAGQYARAQEAWSQIPRTERDIPIHYIVPALIFLSILIGILIYAWVTPAALGGLSSGLFGFVSILGVVYVLVFSFVLASIAAYFAGLVGSSNSPVSGLAVSAILILAVILYPFLSPYASTAAIHMSDAALCIFLVSLITCATTIAGDTIQDLKAGKMVGATPWKQQVILLLGVFLSALVVPLILDLLFTAYGMGDILPPRCGHLLLSQADQCGVNVSQMLGAPQAGLMMAVVKGVFSKELPWSEISVGAVIAVMGIIVDECFKRQGYRFPVLAMGLGIYLPLTATSPLIFGGIVSFFVKRHLHKKLKSGILNKEKIHTAGQSGLLMACGIVAGASIVGVILAVPFILEKNSDAWSLVPADAAHSTYWYQPYGEAGAVLMMLGLCFWLYRTVVQEARSLE